MMLSVLYFIGQNGTGLTIAGVGMGMMLINVICFAFCFGMNGTLETFISQSNGAKNFYMCGAWFNKGRCILTVIFVPIAIIFYFADSILISLAQDPAMSKLARDFVVLTLPGLFIFV